MFTFEQIVKLARAVSLDAYANQHLSRQPWKTDHLQFSVDGEVRSNGRKLKRKWFFYSASEVGDRAKRAFSPRYVIDSAQSHRLQCRLRDLSRRLIKSRSLVSERLIEVKAQVPSVPDSSREEWLWAAGNSPKNWQVLKLSDQGIFYFSRFLGDEEIEKLSVLEQLAFVAFTTTPVGELVGEVVKLSRQLDHVWKLLYKSVALVDAQVGHIAKTQRPEDESVVIVRIRDEEFYVHFEERWPNRPAGGDKFKVVFSRRVQDPIPVLSATPFTFS